MWIAEVVGRRRNNIVRTSVTAKEQEQEEAIAVQVGMQIALIGCSNCSSKSGRGCLHPEVITADGFICGISSRLLRMCLHVRNSQFPIPELCMLFLAQGLMIPFPLGWSQRSLVILINITQIFSCPTHQNIALRTKSAVIRMSRITLGSE